MSIWKKMMTPVETSNDLLRATFLALGVARPAERLDLIRTYIAHGGQYATKEIDGEINILIVSDDGIYRHFVRQGKKDAILLDDVENCPCFNKGDYDKIIEECALVEEKMSI